jgi:hypothetical protein
MRVHMLCFLLVTDALSISAQGHDAKGLMILESLPAGVRTQIQERMFIRRRSQHKWSNDLVAWQGVQSVVRRTAVWTPGVVTSVCFMDGDEAARERVKAIAEIWVHSGPRLRFDFGDMGALRTCDVAQRSLIRVTFKSGGWASQVGQDALLVPAEAATLFLEGLDDPATPGPLLQEIVLHEFGHAIGFEHEHQSPKGRCESEFNWPKVYAYFATLNWDRPKVDQNLRTLPSTSVYDVSTFDSKSIMHYQFDKSLFIDPAHATCLVGENQQLSPQDIAAVQQYYGADSTPLDLDSSSLELQALAKRPNLNSPQRDQISEVLKHLPMWKAQATDAIQVFKLQAIQ